MLTLKTGQVRVGIVLRGFRKTCRYKDKSYDILSPNEFMKNCSKEKKSSEFKII